MNRIDSFVTLVDGRFKNKPSINAFNNIISDVNKVRRTDLFIALEEEDIAQAINNGAYAILIANENYKILDEEIAWIYVDDIEIALFKYLRFYFINKQNEVYYCSSFIIDLLQNINHYQRVVTFKGDIIKEANLLMSTKDNEKIIFSDNKNFLKKLFFNIKTFKQEIKKQIKILNYSTFESSFTYEDKSYYRKNLSLLELKYLEKILNFLDENNIKYNIKNFNKKNHFQVVFVNKNLKICNFGKGSKVLIFEKNIELQSEIEKYFKDKTPWIKTITLKEGEDGCKDEEELIKILKNEDFIYAIILNKDKSLLERINNINIQRTLF